MVAHVANPRYSSVLISTANIILDMYASVVGHSSVIDALLRKLGEKVKTELELQQRLLKLQGLMEMYIHGMTIRNGYKMGNLSLILIIAIFLVLLV